MSDVTINPAQPDLLLDGLTEPQAQAATHVDGPLLVLAGPGSGKTRVITTRIAYLVHRANIAPWNILAITFTNKAAGEMRERIGSLVSEAQSRALTISTFHSLCARILREFSDRLDLVPGYSIYDSADQKRAVKEALSNLQMSTSNYPPGAILSKISHAKNQMLGPKDFELQARDFSQRQAAKVYKAYAKILKRNNALDFDDLLFKTVELFKNNPDVLTQLRSRFKYVLIDEYQDTNHAQFMIANSLASEHKNLCVTGDPDQSIYGWRGANIKNILDFEQQYQDAKVVRLEQNYRSTTNILNAADCLIKQNSGRKHKELWTANQEGPPVHIATLENEQEEAKWLVEKFRYLHDQKGVNWGDMAIFYRINSLSRVVEDGFRRSGVSYQIARGTEFYARKEIKDAIGILQAIANPADEVNLLRIINTPARGISAKTIKALQAYSVAHNENVDDVLNHPESISSINTRAQNSVLKFSAMLKNWRRLAGIENDSAVTIFEDEIKKQNEFTDIDNHSANQEENNKNENEDINEKGEKWVQWGRCVQTTLSDFVDKVLQESGLEKHYKNDKSDPDQQRLANLGELVSSAHQFEQEFIENWRQEEDNDDLAVPQLGELLYNFLQQVSLVADVDGVESEQGSVTLMTLHAAKGLEFPVVAIIGAETGILPHQRAINDITGEQIEEERRLCFVGMTRAKQELFITHAQYRTIFGRTMPAIPSEFLSELPQESIERIEPEENWEDEYI